MPSGCPLEFQTPKPPWVSHIKRLHRCKCATLLCTLVFHTLPDGLRIQELRTQESSQDLLSQSHQSAPMAGLLSVHVRGSLSSGMNKGGVHLLAGCIRSSQHGVWPDLADDMAIGERRHAICHPHNSIKAAVAAWSRGRARSCSCRFHCCF